MAYRREAALPQEVLDGFSNVAKLQCISRDAIFPTGPEAIYLCPNPHEKGRNLVDVVYDFPKDLDPEELKLKWRQRRMSNHPINQSGVWRFREMLPFVEDPNKVVTLGEGNTRLINAPRCAEYVGLENLVVKHQGDNPTGSFKDNGMSAGITEAVILGQRAVGCASTGNTSASMAAYAQRADMLSVVALPDGQIAMGKLAQALDFGALTLQIQDANFDGALKFLMEVAPETGLYVLNSNNPFRIEGQKTIVVEMLEQMDWEVPDRIVVPGGNLGHASSIWKGLRELQALGFIDRLPKITVIQAKGADPLYQTVTSEHPDRIITVHPRTLATAIKIGDPVSIVKALEGIQESDGWVEEVTEQEIADAKAIVGLDGIGCEPASAVTIAGLKKILEGGTDIKIDKGEKVVAILTGNMMKDPDYPVLYHSGRLFEDFIMNTAIEENGPHIRSNYGNMPIRVAADLQQIRQIIESRMARG